MTIKEIQQNIVDEFSMFEDWSEKYEHLILLGRSIPLIDPKYKVKETLIKGCQSKVWLHAEKKESNITFTADSDAIITKGIIAIFVRAFSNQSPQNIINSDIDFIDEIGLKDHLSPSRANGLANMIRQIKLYAVAYQTQIQTK